ncbi:hypothetical protein TRAPUB_13602 [Trametes pubescens]|uniref:Uncharacterized protein n=1 Tax=Trametes pubescens TaxID=154538 RepID=A0A1M2VQM7_TRAPU|nr:hypothetical protein TRAPUB_13657 [Trametes pubescens]OJT09865.1 hypothetical protein TRAPUB_13608 [Trametes pubescens]OJT09914.1 hypothetical protein TRAPUB_13602 [Trametes pubescens]
MLRPTFTTCVTNGPSTSPPKLIPPPVPMHTGNPYGPSGAPGASSSSSSRAHFARLNASASAPNTPDNPESSMSTSTSPSTPLGYEDHNVRVVGSGTIGTPININSSSPGARTSSSGSPAGFARAAPAASTTTQTKKPECGDILARASPAVW